jgi:hypothetical protein
MLRTWIASVICLRIDRKEPQDELPEMATLLVEQEAHVLLV